MSKDPRDELDRSQRELEFAYEELQSTDEELETINGELRHSSDDLDIGLPVEAPRSTTKATTTEAERSEVVVEAVNRRSFPVRCGGRGAARRARCDQRCHPAQEARPVD